MTSSTSIGFSPNAPSLRRAVYSI